VVVDFVALFIVAVIVVIALVVLIAMFTVMVKFVTCSYNICNKMLNFQGRSLDLTNLIFILLLV